MAHIYQFRLANRLSEITRVHNEVEELPLPPRTMFNTNLVLDELLTNIIRYGLPVDEENHIHVRLELHQEHLDILIEDDGIEFNPLQAPEPDLDMPLEQRPIGGLGIFIVRKLASHMHYEREGTTNRLAVQMEMNELEAT